MGKKDKIASDEPLIAVYDHRPEGYDGTCLRPLGLCDLGGCCDTCWYSPDHPRHQKERDPLPNPEKTAEAILEQELGLFAKSTSQ